MSEIIQNNRQDVKKVSADLKVKGINSYVPYSLQKLRQGRFQRLLEQWIIIFHDIKQFEKNKDDSEAIGLLTPNRI